MTIEQYNAGKSQVAAEERSTFLPGIEMVVGLAKKAAGIADLDLPKFGELCADSIKNNSNSNLAYLLECLAKDVARIGVKVEAFDGAGTTEREAFNALVSEAVLRAAEAKSKDRVRRIARIVANAIRSGPKKDYEIERAIHVSCARLQAQGLIIRMERKATSLDLATNPYSMTIFGVQFCEWCLQEVGG